MSAGATKVSSEDHNVLILLILMNRPRLIRRATSRPRRSPAGHCAMTAWLVAANASALAMPQGIEHEFFLFWFPETLSWRSIRPQASVILLSNAGEVDRGIGVPASGFPLQSPNRPITPRRRRRTRRIQKVRPIHSEHVCKKLGQRSKLCAGSRIG